jgi:hypothetical protein
MQIGVEGVCKVLPEEEVLIFGLVPPGATDDWFIGAQPKRGFRL